MSIKPVHPNWKDFLANGVTVSSGETVPQRKHILDITDEELFLYLQGLTEFQNVDSQDPKSWYQIAGIHGLPYTRWPDQSWNDDITAAGIQAGFCTHSSILFLTWHRPYLALFESMLHEHVNNVAKDIVASDPNRNKYLDLAKNFRMPYWDWARKDIDIFPQQALYDKLSWRNSTFQPPKLASGKTLSYNPLFKAPVPANAPVKKYSPQLNTDWTVRYPGIQNPQKAMKGSLKAFSDDPQNNWGFLFPMERNLTERVGYILKSYRRYAAMCSNAIPGTSKTDLKKSAETYGGFEDFHNAVHVLTGNGGHMNHVPAAANDPIFWLHHTNIDRLFAIWQAVYDDPAREDAYVTTRDSGSNTWTSASGTKEGLDSPLYPFMHALDTSNPSKTIPSWHTSKTARRTESFGYLYPETAGLSYPPSQAARNALITQIKDLYPSLADSIRLSQAHVETAGAAMLPQAEVLKTLTQSNLAANTDELAKILPTLPTGDALLQASLEPKKPRLRNLAHDNKYLEWVVNLKAEKHSLGGNFAVHVFLGPVEDDNVALWPISPNHVGSFAPLGQPVGTGCGKCQGDQDSRLEVSGQIPLTIALAERYLAGLIDDLSENAVTSYLTTHLHWRVVAGDGTILANRGDVDGLTVFVASNEVTVPASEDELPVYAQEVTIYPEITTNRDGQGRGDGTGLTSGGAST